MIKEFRIENFKSYREAVLPLAPLTLLIGPNASGKSNALEALQFLSWLARGRRLDDVFRAIQENEITLRGTLGELAHGGIGWFGLEAVLGDDGPWNRLRLRLRADADGMRVEAESIEGDGQKLPLYKLEGPVDRYGHDVAVSYNNFAPGGHKPRITCTDQQAIFTQLQTPARFDKGHVKAQETIPQITGRFRLALENIMFLDPNPRAMRGYSFIVDRILSGNGANISSVLYDLCELQGKRAEVLGFVRSLPEQDIQDIKFWEGPRNDVLLKLTETFGGDTQEWDASALSDGTLRTLAIAGAVLSAPEGTLVVIEEIDNGVHPSRANSLLGNIQRAAEAGGLRVLLTTHNPALVNALPLEAVPHVVACYRDPVEGDSRLIRLEELADYPELVAQGPLGDLMTSGVLDRFLRTRRTLADKKETARAWMRELEHDLEGSRV
jgi:predicted ATPase